MNYKIQALNGFYMYFDQITSVFKAKYEASGNIELDQLAEVTGLNRRKARLILNFLADIGLSRKRNLKGTRLGKIIFQYDEFFQNEGTLWLLHYLQSANEYLIVWNRVMNSLYLFGEFTREDLVMLFEDLKDSISEYSFKHHIGKEIRIILDAYVNQRLSKLNLLEEDSNTYIVHRNPDVPDLILLCAIILYRDCYYPGATALNIDELCNANNSPCRLFILDEHIMRKKLEGLKNRGVINIESRGDLDQIRFGEELKFESTLEEYYRG
jgi:hypothetical protein